MKKLLFMAAMATVSVFTAKAQNNEMPTATLQNGNQTLVFMGKYALQDAYSAALDSGAIITLSPGYFVFDGDYAQKKCSKSLSIYGAGFENDTITGTTPTEIGNEIYLDKLEYESVDNDGNPVVITRDAKSFHCEGLKLKEVRTSINMNNVSFTKCSGGFTAENGLTVENLTIRQSNFSINSINTITPHADPKYLNFYIANSYINFNREMAYQSTGKIDHCIVHTYNIGGPEWFVSNSILYNSLPAGSTALNNIFVGLGSVGNDVQEMGTNWTNVDNADVWAAEGEDGSYAENKTFELENPKRYVGSDGTQVGLHGGDYPWNKIPSTPRIVESNIDTKTSADGKLKVSIKVEAQTKE